jgi:hypothetical protein
MAPFRPVRSYAPWAIGTSVGTLRASVARSRSLEARHTGKKTGGFARTFGDGETRTRTGDTTIFQGSRLAGARTQRGLQVGMVSRRITPLRCCRLRVVQRRFGTSLARRSPNERRVGDGAQNVRSLGRSFLVRYAGALASARRNGSLVTASRAPSDVRGDGSDHHCLQAVRSLRIGAKSRSLW